MYLKIIKFVLQFRRLHHYASAQDKQARVLDHRIINKLENQRKNRFWVSYGLIPAKKCVHLFA